VWSRESYRSLAKVLRAQRPDVAHFHNTFPLLSPSVYYACRAAGVPVVQTLHNYRLLCPTATFFRNGRPCEDCAGRVVPWPGVVHACYRGSRGASAAVGGMLTVHRLGRTWTRAVDVYVALTPFNRDKFVQNGLPADRLATKPNFLSADPRPGAHAGGYALFVGRLAPEKGIATLLEAWHLAGLDISLKIAGAGPVPWHRSPPGVAWLGHQPKAAVLSLMRDASFLVIPSEWYEGFPLVVLEAFATGLPVIASRLGALADIVDDGVTGVHFTPGDAVDLASKLTWAAAHPAEIAEFGRAARRKFEAEYTADHNYELLMDVYRLAIARASAHRRRPPHR
jgi:glycosyltransferase involved in cell wall biosynthesis